MEICLIPEKANWKSNLTMTDTNETDEHQIIFQIPVYSGHLGTFENKKIKKHVSFDIVYASFISD